MTLQFSFAFRMIYEVSGDIQEEKHWTDIWFEAMLYHPL